MTAYAYLRRSSVSADRPGDASRKVQESEVRALAARHGDEPTLLVDWGISGRRADRPAYRDLLAAIASGSCTALYSYSLSRLGRSLPELSRLIADCAERGIPVRLVADSMDTSTASGRLLAHVLASVAAFEADVTGERMRAVYEARRVRGEKVSNTPAYGDGEGEDVEAVAEAFREAGSYSAAARLLNERGVRPRTARAWGPSSVRVVMRRLDPVLASTKGTKGAKAAAPPFVLARLMRCPTCGTRLTGMRDREGKRVRYACKMGSVTPHARVSVSEHLILPAIRAEVSCYLFPDRVRVERQDAKRRADLDARRERVIDLMVSGTITRQEAEPRLQGIAEELATLDAHRTALDVPRVEWDEGPAQVNRVLAAMFERIELDAETFQPLGFVSRVPEWRLDNRTGVL